MNMRRFVPMAILLGIFTILLFVGAAAMGVWFGIQIVRFILHQQGVLI
jgi:hypothetical protein